MTTSTISSTSETVVPTSRTDWPHIALIGKAGAGKTTGAEFLYRQYGYRRLSFAKALKALASYVWGPSSATDRDKHQKLGVAVRDIDEDAWLNLLLKQLDLSIGVYDNPIVIDDCRFPNEYWALKERGFVFVRVGADVPQRLMRLKANGKLQDEGQLTHVSETSLDHIIADHNVPNDTTINEFEGRLCEVLTREAKRT